MKISIVVPAYNEGHRLPSTIETLRSFCERRYEDWEIIVVDDGSTDNTRAVLESLSPEIRGLHNAVNRGKGFSVKRGMAAAKLDPVLFTDADLSTPIEEVIGLEAALEAGADIAIGSRSRRSEKVQRTWKRKLMALVFRVLVKVLVVRGFGDTQSGFKLFRAEAAREISALQRLDRWGFDVELLYIARKLGWTVVEVPVAYRESAESRLRLWTPLTMIGDLLKVRINALMGWYSRPPK